MPNIGSAIKRMRQNTLRRSINRSRRSRMRTMIKKFRQLVQEEKLDDARALLPAVFSIIDKTAQKGTIHSNTAARYKSRLAKSLE